EHDPVTTNNTSSVTVTRVPLVDVAVLKTVNNSTPDVGKNVTFTIKATNAGPSDATNTVVNDALPTGYTLVSATPTAGTYTAGVWTIGTLVKDAEETLMIVATVNATGSYTNTATISATEKEIVTSNNTSSVTPVPVPVAELSIVKTLDNATPDAGSEVVFTVNVTNAGPSTATGVKVTEQLKSGYTYKSSTVTAGTYDAATGIWNIGTQHINITNTLTITAVVNPTGDYSNSASVSGNEKDTQGTDDVSTITTPIVRAITDLAIVKTVDHTTADAGSEVNFTLTASNKGVSTATNVVVNDVLPSGFTFVSSTSSNYNATTGVWSIGTLAKDATASITIKAIVNATGTYVNTATIAGTEHDPVTTNNTSAVTVTRVPYLDVAVTIGVNNSTPDVATNVTFTITATNNGPSTATNTVVNNLLPSGYTLVSANAATGSYTNGVWNIGTMAPGASTTLTVVATVRPTGTYTNTATIGAAEKETILTNNTASVTPTPVTVADISIAKSINNSTPDVGSQVVFTLTATNNGPSTATNVVATDMLQTGYTFVSATASAGTYNAATGTWTIGTLHAGTNATLTITARVNAGGNYGNTASITSNEKETNTGNNTSTITTPVPVPVTDLSIAKVVDDVAPYVGKDVNFTITVKNDGPSHATGVTMNDVLPTGYAYVSATASTGTYNATTGTWQIGALANGATATVTIKATILATGQFTNTATVTGNEKDLDASNNSASASTIPVANADLQITKSTTAVNPHVGDDITFTLVAKNNGPSDATNVIATDLLKAGYVFKSANPSTGTYNATTGTWTIGNMTNGATATLTITANIKGGGAYDNTATIRGNETDLVPANNTSTINPAVITLVAENDFGKTEEPTPVTVNVVKNDTYGNTGNKVVLTSNPQNGTVRNNNDGTVTYTPNEGFEGTDIFTYQLEDNLGNKSNMATVSIDVTKRLIDLAIAKVLITAPSDVMVGKNVTFDITVTNKSAKTATNVVVEDILESNIGDNFTQLQTFNGKAKLDMNTRKITWTVGQLTGGQVVKLTITAKVTGGGAVKNTATVSGADNDPDITNNTSTAAVPEMPNKPGVFIPTLITPNGDGQNDKFVILGLEKFPGSKLIIWNRWGNVVFRSNDYLNNWDGSQLNEGTYFYELVTPTQNGPKTYKGWLQLMR
ncbi:putative repeat protein (TIGR01451 family)/gliding motility-associated-like protein, partial [Chitinophaga skermanii]